MATSSAVEAVLSGPLAHAPVVPPVPSATLLLVRDGNDGLEVLLTSRHSALPFAAGAAVFPGGKVGSGDHRWRGRCPASRSLDDAALALRVAAIRETFEECGILLARNADGGVVGPDALRPFDGDGPRSTFESVIGTGRLEPAVDLLIPFAHWITPAGLPMRFDTHFFLAPAPPGQIAALDGREVVALRWTTPAAAMAKGAGLDLMLPTRLNLAKLGRFGTVAAALAGARAAPVVTVESKLVQTPTGPAYEIPEAAGYGISLVPIAETGRR